MVIDVKVAWVKQQTDKKNFRLQENMGWEVLKIQDVEETDQKLEELIQKQYDTIIISNELSYFSEDIIRKYQKGINKGLRFNTVFNDLIGIRMKVTDYSDQYPNHFRM